MAKDNKKLVEAITSMDVDFAQWYTDVVKKAELIDYSAVKGCMIIRPAGYADLGRISRKSLDRRFKETGVRMYTCRFLFRRVCSKKKRITWRDLHRRLHAGNLRRIEPAAGASLRQDPHLRHCSAIFIKILFTPTVTSRRYTTSGARWYAGRRRRDRSSVPGSFCGRRDTPRMRPQRKPSSARFRC